MPKKTCTKLVVYRISELCWFRRQKLLLPVTYSNLGLIYSLLKRKYILPDFLICLSKLQSTESYKYFSIEYSYSFWWLKEQ